MSSQAKRPNPWNKTKPKTSTHSLKNKNRNHNSVNNTQKNPTPSEVKFKEAQAKLQEAVKKHVKDFESSSEEEELESEAVIGMFFYTKVIYSQLVTGEILKNYSETGAKDEFLSRTKMFIQDAFHSGVTTCLICISTIKRDSEASCDTYFYFF